MWVFVYIVFVCWWSCIVCSCVKFFSIRVYWIGFGLLVISGKLNVLSIFRLINISVIYGNGISIVSIIGVVSFGDG